MATFVYFNPNLWGMEPITLADLAMGSSEHQSWCAMVGYTEYKTNMFTRWMISISIMNICYKSDYIQIAEQTNDIKVGTASSIGSDTRDCIY